MLRPVEDLIAAALNALTAFTGNVGLAVILLTVIVRIIFHPLSRYGLKAIKKMQSLAPQLEVLRRKHRENPQKANIEIMNLYRSSGVNPLGGCLPSLLQLPVMFALYRVLIQEDMFKGQAFLGVPLDARLWPLALIAQNPVLVLFPILMAVTTYIQQRMSITDPQQARMFVFMPIFFAFFSFQVPVILSLYWIASTVVGIFEYYLVLGRLGRPPAPPATPPRERQAARRQKRRTRPA